MITKLKGRVSIFEGVFSDFLAVALSNKAFKANFYFFTSFFFFFFFCALL
jgi:hypothetical protein